MTAGVRFRLEVKCGEQGDAKWVVEDVSAVFGGVGPTSITAVRAAAGLRGQEWGAPSIEAACLEAQREIGQQLNDASPGGQATYRSTLVPSFIYKSFLAVNAALGEFVEAANKEECELMTIMMMM